MRLRDSARKSSGKASALQPLSVGGASGSGPTCVGGDGRRRLQRPRPAGMLWPQLAIRSQLRGDPVFSGGATVSARRDVNRGTRSHYDCIRVAIR